MENTACTGATLVHTHMHTLQHICCGRGGARGRRAHGRGKGLRNRSTYCRRNSRRRGTKPHAAPRAAVRVCMCTNVSDDRCACRETSNTIPSIFDIERSASVHDRFGIKRTCNIPQCDEVYASVVEGVHAACGVVQLHLKLLVHSNWVGKCDFMCKLVPSSILGADGNFKASRTTLSYRCRPFVRSTTHSNQAI